MHFRLASISRRGARSRRRARPPRDDASPPRSRQDLATEGRTARAASSVSPRAQVFIFVTISKFGALTCSIIGLARKITTLVASIIIYGHSLNMIQVR